MKICIVLAIITMFLQFVMRSGIIYIKENQESEIYHLFHFYQWKCVMVKNEVIEKIIQLQDSNYNELRK